MYGCKCPLPKRVVSPRRCMNLNDSSEEFHVHVRGDDFDYVFLQRFQ